MADLDVGLGALGGKLHAHVKAVPPFGWVGLVAFGAVAVLAWHFWDQDAMDSSDWTDPEQPPENVDTEPLRPSIPTNTRMTPGWDLAALRGRRSGSQTPGAC